MFYGSETWTLRNEDIKRLEACEIWIQRKCERISWTEKIANKIVLKRVDDKQQLQQTIRQHNWIGHTLRHKSSLKDVIEGRIEAKPLEEAKGYRCWITA